MIITISHIDIAKYIDNKCIETTYNLGINVTNDSNLPLKIKNFGFEIKGKQIFFGLEKDIVIESGFVHYFSKSDSMYKDIIKDLNIANYESASLHLFVVDKFNNCYYCSNPFNYKNLK